MSTQQVQETKTSDHSILNKEYLMAAASVLEIVGEVTEKFSIIMRWNVIESDGNILNLMHINLFLIITPFLDLKIIVVTSNQHGLHNFFG